MGRTDKNTRILLLLHALQKGAVVDKASFSIENNMTGRSFDRDIQSIRIFLSEAYSPNELIYDREVMGYRLTDTIHSELSGLEAMIAIKGLLHCELLREDELTGIIDSILSLVPRSERMLIKKTVLEDVLQYTAPAHNKALFKLIWDLLCVITRRQQIVLRYLDEDVAVSPYAVEQGLQGYYLVAKTEHQKQFCLFKLEHIDFFSLMSGAIFERTVSSDELTTMVQAARKNEKTQLKHYLYQGGHTNEKN